MQVSARYGSEFVTVLGDVSFRNSLVRVDVYQYIFIYLSVCLSVSQSVCLSAYPPTYLHLSFTVCLSFCHSVCLSASQSTKLSASQSVRMPISMPACLASSTPLLASFTKLNSTEPNKLEVFLKAENPNKMFLSSLRFQYQRNSFCLQLLYVRQCLSSANSSDGDCLVVNTKANTTTITRLLAVFQHAYVLKSSCLITKYCTPHLPLSLGVSLQLFAWFL